MKLSKVLKAIFFAMDGVLIDSMLVHVKSWKEALEEFGFKANEEEFLKRGGLSFKETIRQIAELNNKKVSEKITKEIYLRKELLFLNYKNSIIPFNIKEKLKELKLKEIKLYVVTSSPKKFTKAIIERNFSNIFECIVSGDEVKKCKPNPEPYLKALEISGFEKKDCLIVEDAPLGVESAKRAGIKVFAITTSVLKEELKNADKVFDSHKKLFEYIKANLL